MHCAFADEPTDSLVVSKGEFFTPTAFLSALSNYRYLSVQVSKSDPADPSHWYWFSTVMSLVFPGLRS